MDQRRHPSFGDDEIACLGALDFDVGARGVEVVVVGNDVPALERGVEQNALGGTALVGGDHVPKPCQVLHDRLKAEERPAARVRFVALHQRPPLGGGHGACARIGEQID